MQMKRIIAPLVLIAFVTALIAPGFAQPVAPITVYVNGRALSFDVPPTVIQGRVLVRMRGIFERLGATVDYNPATQQINATDGSQMVQLTVGSRQAVVNGAPEMLSVPAFTINGRTMVPLRFISEGLGAEVQWVAANNAILITEEGAATSVPVTVPTYIPPVTTAPSAQYVPPVSSAVSGRLVAVNLGPTPSIVVRTSGQDVTVPVTADTAIYRYTTGSNAGGSAALGALRSGDMVAVQMNDRGQAAKITATYHALLGGRIASVGDRTIRLATGQSYIVLPDAQITLNGQSAGFEVIQAGRDVRFSLVQGTNQAYEVNVTFPVSTAIPVPVGLSAPGISAPTNDATVGNAFVVSGRARPGATVVVTAEPRLLGQTVQGTTRADGDGAWAVSLNVQALPMVAFPYVVTATQIIDGMQSDPSSIEVTIR